MIVMIMLMIIVMIGNLFHNDRQVGMAMVLMSIQRRLYNSYLEVKFWNISTTITATMIATTITRVKLISNADDQAVYCSFPGQRTQPVSVHKLKKEKDIVGRFPFATIIISIFHPICPTPHHDDDDDDDD